MLGDRSPFAGLLALPSVTSTLGTRYPFQGKRAQVWYRAGGIPIWGYPTSRYILLPKPSSLLHGQVVGVLGGGVKVAENQSPQPRDRVFFSAEDCPRMVDHALDRALASFSGALAFIDVSFLERHIGNSRSILRTGCR